MYFILQKEREGREGGNTQAWHKRTKGPDHCAGGREPWFLKLQ